ncbi:MAG TPA: tetratricopeptide repeat protein [Nitrospiria bacterium]
MKHREPRVPEAHRQIFNEADRAFHNLEFQEAGLRFRSLIDFYPETPLREEAEWMIGRSLEEGGNYSQALRLYREFLEGHPNSVHRNEARFRVDHLKDLISQGPAVGGFIRPVGAALESVPRVFSGKLPNVLPESSIPGERVVMIPGFDRSGINFDSDHILVTEGGLPEFISEAQGLGWRVWVRVPLRRMPGLESAKGQRDLFFQTGGRRMVPSEGLNLQLDAVTQRLSRILRDLARTGADGIVIDDVPLYQPEEGFNRRALSAFKKDFGFLPRPAEWFEIPRDDKRDAESQSLPSDPDYWKWAGFRNRDAMKRIESIIHSVSKDFPDLVWVHRVSPETVDRPEWALARFGEDLLQSLRSGFDFVLMPFSFRERGEGAFPFLRKAVKTASIPERIILSVPGDERNWITRNQNDLPRVGYLFRGDPKPGRAALTKPGR